MLASGVLEAAAPAGGGGLPFPIPPAGEVIFSDGTILTGDANLTWDATSGLLVKKNISAPIQAVGDFNEGFGAGITITLGTIATTVLGRGASAAGSTSIVIGESASIGSAGTSSIAIGRNASNSGTASVAIGANSSIGSFAYVTMIGDSHTATHNATVLLGQGMTSVADNELVFGSRGISVPSAPSFRLKGSVLPFTFPLTQESLFRIGTSWIDGTESTRKSRASLYVYDTAEREFMRADAKGSAQVDVQFLSGGNSVFSGAVLATNATDGFVYLPTSAGAPTGVPTAFTGAAATEIDETNNDFYIYSNGAWHKVGTGAQGPAGRDGVSGLDGTDGIDGQDSYLPGPTGRDGTPGTAGRDGISFLPDSPEDPELPMMVPGPQGIQGIQGISGTAGREGATILPDLPEDPELPMMIPGPVGAQGASGASSSVVTMEYSEDVTEPPFTPPPPEADPKVGRFAPGNFTIPTGSYAVMSAHLILNSTQRANILGTGRLRIT